MKGNGGTSPAETVLLACSKCGASLPDGAQFCLKCGKPVSSPQPADVVEIIPPLPPQPQRRPRHLLPWLIAILVVAAIAWVVTSDNPAAQGLQEVVGWKHDQTILDTPFTIGAHSFRYYKFSLPEGSLNVSLMGEFTVSADSHPTVKLKAKTGKAEDPAPDNNIELYVLSEPAFTIWQNGYATSSVYDSGRVSQGHVQAEIPAGAGIYFLVFDNKFAPKSPKSIQASVFLRYKSWLPDWFLRMKGRLFNWFGL